MTALDTPYASHFGTRLCEVRVLNQTSFGASGYHGCVFNDDNLLGYDTASLGNRCLTFRRH